MSVALALQIIQGLMALMVQLPSIASAVRQIIEEIEAWYNDTDETSEELIARIREARQAVMGTGK